MNIVMTHIVKFLEIQGTAEKGNFSKDQVLQMLTAAEKALQASFDLQAAALKDQGYCS